jgi:ABC-type Fe3+/spermidine/putrescine transport system ATPase subunit
VANVASGLSAAVSVLGLRKAFSSTEVLRGINLEIPQGSYAALLGASGSGKTTLLRIIAGFLSPDKGSVLIGGTDMTFLPARSRQVGMVFQNYALFPHLTARENIEYPLKLRKLAPDKRNRLVDEYLDRVQLTAVRNHYPNQLSGGQQQRVALARGLVYGPKLLLLDEPLGALDKRLRTEMQHFLRTLQRELKITFVHVTHDQEEALALATHVVVLRSGVIEQVGSPEGLYYEPVSQYVASFIGESNLFPCRYTPTCVSHISITLDSGVSAKLPTSALASTISPTSFEGILALRPEDAQIVNGIDVLDGICAVGAVGDVTFLGAHYEAIVATNIGSVAIRTPARLQIGDPIKIFWPAAKCRVLPRE